MSDNLLQFSAPIELTAAADKPVRISIMAYGGDVMTVSGFGPTIIDLTGLDASHPVQLLAEHRDNIDGLLGTGTATKTNTDLRVDGTLTRANPQTNVIVAMAQDGVQFSASVGVQLTEREFVQEGQTVSANGRTVTAPHGGLVFAKRGILRETSLVAIGADASASVSIAASLKSKSKGKIMSENIVKTPDILQAERDRTANINTKCDAMATDQLGKVLPDRLQTIRASAIADGWTIGKTENELLRAERDAYKVERIRAERPHVDSIHGSTNDGVNRDTGGTDILQAALLSHLGHDELASKTLGEKATSQARRLQLNSLHDVLRSGLQQSGQEVPAGRDSMIRAAFSTNAVSGILSNVANKLSTASYQAAPSVARTIARKLTANDFKTHTGYRLTADATFDEVGNAGEIKHGTLGESSYTYSVATHARMFGLTRQDVINDDLGKFEEVPRLLGRGAAVKLEQLFWTLVLANTGSFFHDDNANQITAALTIGGLSSAVETLRKLVDANGDPISITPKYLVAPPELEATADALFASTNIVYASASAVPDSNPYKGKYQPQVSPYLSNSNYTGYSTTGWYLFGDPGDVAAFGIAYLNGQENPTIEQADADFNTLGIQFRGYLDMGVCQIDSAGAVKSTGAGE